MWSELIQRAQSKMNNSAQSAQRNDQLIKQMQNKTLEDRRNNYSVPITGQDNRNYTNYKQQNL